MNDLEIGDIVYCINREKTRTVVIYKIFNGYIFIEGNNRINLLSKIWFDNDNYWYYKFYKKKENIK